MNRGHNMQVSAALNGRVVTAFVMLLIFVTMSLMALGFPEKARLMPLMVGVPGSLLGLIQLIIEIRHSEPQTMPDAHVADMNKAERSMFVWIFLYFFGILGFGFIFAAPVLVFGFLYIGRKESFLISLISAVATWAVLFGFFEKGFEIPLFTGLIIESIIA
jgi:hypothetical protein